MIEPPNRTVMLAVSSHDPDAVDVLLRDDASGIAGSSDRRWFLTGEPSPITWAEVLDQVRIADLTLVEMVRRDELAVSQ